MKTCLSILLILVSPQLSLAKAPTVNLGADKASLEIATTAGKNKIALQLPADMSVENSPKAYGDNDFSLIVTEMADDEAATTQIHALDGSGKVLWMKDLKAFNPSAPLIEKDFIYLSTIGKVWKIAKFSGKVVWQRDGLYESLEFNGGDPVSRKGTVIEFASNVRIDDKTGELEQVKK